jgi:putative ABC transport system substrate-binding protein
MRGVREGRRLLGGVATLVALLAAAPAGGQPAAKVSVGVVGAAPEPLVRQSLRERGWVDGENLLMYERYTEGGDLTRIPALVAELVNRGVALIVALGNTSTAAAQRATRGIPVVFLGSEPVERGFVSSLARPGGNLTGVAGLSGELNAKRLEVLREVFPRINRLALLHRPSETGRRWRKELEPIARRLGFQLVPVEISHVEDFDRAVAVLAREHAGALVPVSGPYFRAEKERLVRLASRLRIPGLYEDRSFVEAGGLMSYGPDRRDMFRRIAAQVDQILKGAKPAEVPVEQVTRIEFVVSDKSAKALGLTFSPQVLSRADEVIR